MHRIQFFNEDIVFTLKNKKSIALWVEQCILTENFLLGKLNFIFSSDEHLLTINRKYLNHDYYTDVITFDNSTEQKTIEGDVFISIDRVRENAQENFVSLTDEIRRIIIHGVLHLCEYYDKSLDDKTKMTEKENAYLSLLKI
jgi:probable rRNA maturation factor